MKRAIIRTALLLLIGIQATDVFAGQYIVKRKYLVAPPNGKLPPPISKDDVVRAGGKVDFDLFDRLVITIPDAAVQAIRKHGSVKYLQRVLVGEQVPVFPTDTLQASQLTPAADISPPSWASGTYVYDGRGNIRSIGSDTYTYDAFGRLETSTTSGVSANFQYDPYGNMTRRTVNGVATVYNVDVRTNQLSGTDGYRYDTAGNNGGIGTIYYDYDAFSMIREHDNPNTELYVYNADDERIGALTGNVWTWSFRDFDGHVLRQYLSDDRQIAAPWSWVEDYVYRDGMLLGAERVPEEGGRRHFHLDHLGTPRLITGRNGEQVSEHTYYPFGIEQTALQEVATGFDRDDPMRYTGHERDYGGDYSNDNYNDYMHARYYTPGWGRFLSVDPVLGDPHNPQSWNRYSYVNNNPMNYVDPDGKQAAPGQFYVTGQGWTNTSPLEHRLTPDQERQMAMQFMAVTGTILGGFLIKTIVDIAIAPQIGPEEVPPVDTAKGTAGGDRAGKPFTPKGKEEIFDRNAEANGGTNKCEGCGMTVVPGQQSQKGVTPPGNERQADHIIPKSKGGDGSPSNGQTLCRDCNLDKRDRLPPP